MDSSRRRFLKGAAAGGVILATGALGGAGGFKAGQSITRVEYELEITKLRTLLKLYQELEKVGIDALLETALKAVTLPLETVKKGLEAMKGAVGKAEEALSRLLSFLSRWRDLLKEGEEILSALASWMGEAGAAMVKTLGRVLPFAEAVIDFFARLLQKLPFGAGKAFGEALESIKTLLEKLPEAVDRVSRDVFRGLREDIFPGNGSRSRVEEEFSEPIKVGLLEPLKEFLENVAALVDSLEKDFAEPIETALAERTKIRQQIEEFRRQYNL